MEKQVKITSDDCYSSPMKRWYTSHTLYVDGQKLGQSSSISSLIEDSELTDFAIVDEHTSEVLSGDYSSEWISKRYAKR